MLTLVAVSVNAAPANFPQAKKLAKEKVYYDRTEVGDTYCGCKWRWVGASGGRTELASCGYEIRSNKVRAERVEWEHVVTASSFGHLRQCWQNGGRKNCNATDPTFNAMEADLFNLTPVVGEVNADRSNFLFGVLPHIKQPQYGQCDFKVDFKQRTAEPSDKVKGMIARTYFYMHDTYNLNMSRQQQQLFMAWDKMFPVTAWELERERRISKEMGRRNPFVTGDKTWTLNHKNSGVGVVKAANDNNYNNQSNRTQQPRALSSKPNSIAGGIKGNKNSKIYHLPTGCPSYDKMSAHNAVFFASEREAQDNGFRKAGNCR